MRRVAAALVLLPAAAWGARPDTGGSLHDYALTDVVESVDSPSGRVRVHYSAQGPSVTRLDDEDADGVPDLPQAVAATADLVLDTFAAAGFRPLLSEADVGLGPLGGSEAFDFYLVEFDGQGDGNFAVDGCRRGVCAGHMLIDNDFREFGYPSVEAAVRVLASHEMFHGVQAAYRESLPVWLSEGTAVWAEDLFHPGVQDFLDFANAYLDDAERPIDRPPVGPVPAFAYGSCLFWKYLTLRFGDDLMPALLEATIEVESEDDMLDAVEAVLGPHGASLRDVWIGFTEANLLTSVRGGDAAFYPFAGRLNGLKATGRGATIAADHRFYPLAASYWVLNHPGGPIFFGAADDGAALDLALTPVADGTELGPALATFAAVEGQVVAFGEQPAGSYWLRGTFPERARNSVKVQFCLGGEEALGECGLTVPAEPDAAIAPDVSVVDAMAADAAVPADAVAVSADANLVDPDVTTEPPSDTDGGSGGGGCAAGADRGAPWMLVIPALLAVRRRRRASPRV